VIAVPVFDYSAIDAEGRSRAGRIEAESREAAVRRLQGSGSLPVELRQAGAGPALRQAGRAPGDRALRPRDLARVTRGLGLLTGADLPLDQALEALAGSEAAAAPRAVLRAVGEAVRGGTSLGTAAAERPRAFPPWWSAAVAAADGTGRLPAVLDRLAADILRGERLAARLRAALTYPALVLALSLAALGVLAGVVLPALEPLLTASGGALPWSTRLLLEAAAMAREGGAALLALLLAALLAARRLLALPAARRARDARLLRAPLCGPVLRAIATARFARPLALLLGAGVALPEALGHAAAACGNAALADALRRARDAVAAGARLAVALSQQGALPPLAVTLVAIGEEGGRLREMLEEAALIHEEIAERATERLLVLLGPVATLLLGGLVAGVVLATLEAMLGANAAAMGAA
jgi:general secretion pathway protein F